MKRSIIPVSVNQGEVATSTREKLLAALSQDGQYIVTIEKQRKKRSPDQKGTDELFDVGNDCPCWLSKNDA